MNQSLSLFLILGHFLMWKVNDNNSSQSKIISSILLGDIFRDTPNNSLKFSKKGKIYVVLLKRIY